MKPQTTTSETDPTRRILVIAAAAIAVASFLPISLARAGAVPAETPKPMRIGVIGAGSLGGTVGSVLVKAGHEVKFSSRHPDELLAMTRELGPRLSVRRAKRRSLGRSCCSQFLMKRCRSLDAT